MPKDPTQTMVCSSCGETFDFTKTLAPPFCSQRCRMIDLGRWLDEEISVPHEGGPTNGEAVEQATDSDEE